MIERRRSFVVRPFDLCFPPQPVVELLLDKLVRASCRVAMRGDDQLAVDLQQFLEALHERRHVAAVFARDDDRARVGHHVARQQGLRRFLQEAQMARIVPGRVNAAQSPLRIAAAEQDFVVVQMTVDLEGDLSVRRPNGP